MTDKRKLGRGMIVIDEERLATDTFEFDGETFTVRELTGDESDEAFDAALDDKKELNSRLNTRLVLAKALVDPTVSADRIGKWGSRKYGTILRHVNRLNSLDDANPTPPAGGAGPTPPGGGEPSPAS